VLDDAWRHELRGRMVAMLQTLRMGTDAAAADTRYQ